MKNSFMISTLFALVSCVSPSSKPTAQSNSPDVKALSSNDSEVALVWVRPDSEKPVQTYWMEAVNGKWTVLAQKTGLFMAKDGSIVEVVDTYADHELPPNVKPPKEVIPGDPDCNDEITELTQDEYGLFFTDLLAGHRTLVKLRSRFDEASKLAVVYHTQPMGSMLLGSVGSYLFIRDLRREFACTKNPAHVESFYIVDSATSRVVLMLGDGDTGMTGQADAADWDKLYLKPAYYNPILKKMQDEKDKAMTDQLDGDDLQVGYLYPELNLERGLMEMQVVFRFFQGCRVCVPLDSDPSPTTDLPKDLQLFAKVHPAAKALAPLVTKGSRLGGFTVLEAPVKNKATLKQKFAQ